MINASGFKVWPAEVENVLYIHPAIHEVCVIGVPDAHRGETVKAVITLKKDYADPIDAAALIDWCRGKLSNYKIPRRVRFIDELPKSSTRSEEHTSELQSRGHLVCRLLLEKKKP